MFILIFFLNILIQPVYAQTVPVPTVNLPIGNSPTQVPTDEPTVIQPIPPTQTITSSPTIAPTIADTPIPTITIAPTAITTPLPTTIPTVTGTVTSTPTTETINGATVTPSPWPTEVVTESPTWTPFPVKPANYQNPPPIIPGIIKGASETFAPDVTFPSSFLKFEKDAGNVYASTQLSPSQTRMLLLVALVLIISGLGLIFYRKVLVLIPNRQIVDNPNVGYAMSEATN